jgi:hypothetical protein
MLTQTQLRQSNLFHDPFSVTRLVEQEVQSILCTTVRFLRLDFLNELVVLDLAV